MTAVIRPARGSDVDALTRIETAAFATDRISRRSFRQLIDRDTADTLVAEVDGAVAGYAMVLYRRGSGVARLYSLAVAPGRQGAGLGARLLAAAEAAAYARDRLVLRLEVREADARAVGFYLARGYRGIGRETGYYADGAAALRCEKRLRGSHAALPAVPYHEQSTDFTCGPACLMMARAHFDPAFRPDAVTEIRLWREATTVFMMSGPGGCEPYGLAVAAHENGLAARLIVSADGPLFLDSVRSAEKRKVMQLAQADFRARVARHRIAVARRAFTLADIRGALAGGRLVAVLVSGFLMFGKKVPHWVLVIGADDGHLVLHDPWVEAERGETAADAAAIPVPDAVFMRIAQFGRAGLRAAVILGAPTGS